MASPLTNLPTPSSSPLTPSLPPRRLFGYQTTLIPKQSRSASINGEKDYSGKLRSIVSVKASNRPPQPKEFALKAFHDHRALKIISGLSNFNEDLVASVVTAADRGGATHIDIACDPELVKLSLQLTSLPICVSSINPADFVAAVEAGAHMVEIGNYDSFYDTGIEFSPEQILQLAKETRTLLETDSVLLSVTVPRTLSLPDQVLLAEMLEDIGVDVIQTEGGKCSHPSQSGVIGLIEKATPTLAAAYSISRAVRIPVLCSSGLSSVTAPMALAAGASGVGVGSAVNKLNDVVAMIAEVRALANALNLRKQGYNMSLESLAIVS